MVVVGKTDKDPVELGSDVQVRSHLTIVFADLTNSTKLAELLEPEDYGHIIQEFRERSTTLVSSHGGVSIRTNGDDLLFVLGYPNARPDAVECAIDICIKLNELVSNLGGFRGISGADVQLHSGIHSGVVLVKPGSLQSGVFDLLGEPLNVSKKLCDLARPGEILISEMTLGGERYKFSTSELYKFSPWPGGEPIGYRKIVSALNYEHELDARLENLRTKFSGRKGELHWLVHLIKSEGRETQIATVVGEAGMGKTRLIREFISLAIASEAIVFSVTCQRASQSTILKPIRHLAKAILPRVSELVSTDFDKMIGVSNPELDFLFQLANYSNTNIARENIVDLAASMLSALNLISNHQPMVLVFDDWQWADDFSCAVLESLARGRVASGLLIVLASRQVPQLLLDNKNTQCLRLGPLDSLSIKQTISSLVTLADPSTRKRIEYLSGGNPLYVEELCHAAVDGEGELQIPSRNSWLHTLISARYSKLDEKPAGVLRKAAVLGNNFSKRMLCQLAGISEDDEVFGILENEDFLFPAEEEGKLVFKHGLTGEAIYSLVGLAERRRSHERVLEFISTSIDQSGEQDINNKLAYHYAGCGQHREAVRHAFLAGQMALNSSALGSAQSLFRFALEELYKARDSGFSFAKIVTSYGKASVVDPSWEQLSVLEQAARWAAKKKHPSDEVLCRYWIAFILYGVGEPKKSLARLQEAQIACDNIDDPILSMRIRLTMGQILAVNSLYDLAEPELLDAVNVQREFYEQSGNPGAFTYTLSSYAFMCADQGRFGESAAKFDQAVSTLDRHEHEVILSVLGYRAVSELWQGHFSDAVETSREVIDTAGRMRSRYIYNYFHIVKRIASFLMTGDVALIDGAVRISEGMTAGSLQRQSILYGYFAECYAQIGNYALARKYAARALLRTRKSDYFGEAQAYRAVAIAANAREQPVVSKSYLEKALRSGNRRISLRENLLTHTLADMLNVSLISPQEGPVCPDDFLPKTFYNEL